MMSGRCVRSILLMFLMASATTVFAAASAPNPSTAETPNRPGIFDRVEEFRLPNGMLFLLLPSHHAPMISGRILFRVGNVDNPIGQTGMAHMFEHMAFKGTDRIGSVDYAAELGVQDSVAAVGAALSREVGKRERGDSTRIATLRAELERLTDKQIALTVPMEFMRVYDGYTFDFNAYTSEDFTVYYTDIPANHLEVWMLMDSERIQHPSFREFYRERDVVMEERRQRTEDDPTGSARELLQMTAFTAHPYRFPTIGFMSDLETLTQEQAEAFRKLHYVPGNSIAALVGDFDPRQAKQMIQDYFGDIPAGPLPPEVTTVEPPQRGMRRAVHRQGTERKLWMCFPGYLPTERRAAVARLLASVLSRDATSRLDRRLDFEERAVRNVWVDSDGDFGRYRGIFLIGATPLENFTNERVEEMIWEELARVIAAPVSLSKLDEIRSSYRKRYYRSLETNHALAEQLVDHQAIFGDWRESYRRFDLYDSVSVEEITELARELFQRGKATIVYLEPEAEDAVEAEGGES